MTTDAAGRTPGEPTGARPIVDSHHHLWRRADLPWLDGAPVPRIFGPYEPIRRDYLAAEYIAEATANGVTASVYLQTNWPLDRSVAEVRWVQEIHERTGWPTAIVGCADLFDDHAVDTLRAQRDVSPLMRGTRLQLHWHERPEFRFASAPDRTRDRALRRNLEHLAELGWLFELQVFPGQFADAVDLVRDLPQLTFVLVHAGMLESLDPGHVEPWRAGLRDLAELPNVVVKLTGQGTFCHRVDPELIGLVTRECLDLFGAHRCMWGSNFPVEKLWTDYGTLVRAWREALASYPEEVRRAVLAGTARRVYRLDSDDGADGEVLADSAGGEDAADRTDGRQTERTGR